MATTQRHMATTQSVQISFRTRPAQITLIDRAAAASGKDRTSFVLDVACREAENLLLDRRIFHLDEKSWDQFIAALDAPPAPNPALVALMARKPLWERKPVPAR